jgi:hypothetical protein
MASVWRILGKTLRWLGGSFIIAFCQSCYYLEPSSCSIVIDFTTLLKVHDIPFCGGWEGAVPNHPAEPNSAIESRFRLSDNNFNTPWTFLIASPQQR